jgi:parallel beta-helix repeat protein
MISTTRPRGRARKRALVPRLVALEDRIVLATLIVNPAGGPGVYTTIGAAVTAANPAGDTIQIVPATYTEQLTIGKSLTMTGTGPGAIIQSPTTLTQDPVTGLYALVEINNGATVNMSDLTIQGPVGPFTQPATISAGILVVGGATANVTNSMIAHIRNDPLTGVGNTGQAIQIGGARGSGLVGTATITNDIITDYQKTGILVRGGSTATITGNTITGSGPTPAIAQNGIQIDLGATATITGNTVTGNEYTGSTPNPTDSNQATGILINNFPPVISGGPITVSNNTIGGTAAGAGNDLGISSSAPEITVQITGNTLQGNRFEGILLSDGTASVSNNTISGSNIGMAVVAFSGDTANANGTLTSNNITNSGNGGVTFPGAGILLLNETGATTTAQATAHFNRIVGNSVGLNNTTAAATDATLNWWGSNTGPNTIGNDTTSSNVTTGPWLVLGLSTSFTTIGPGGTAAVTASVLKDSNGATHSAAPFFPDGVPIAFAATGGTMTPASAPTQSGVASSSFTSTTSGAASASATLDNQTLSTPITIQPLSITQPATPQEILVGQPFGQQFQASGGAGGFTYTVAVGQLPPGLALDPSTGLLSGSPTTPGSYAFSVQATDLSTATAAAGLTLVVYPPVTISPNTPSVGTVGTPYADQLAATGGLGTITFALASEMALPPGLALSAAGLISGTPSTAGTFPFTVTASDQRGNSDALALTIMVLPRPITQPAPVVEGLQRFGFHAQPTTFVLTFSTALEPASAEDVANYRLNPISGHHLGQAIPIKKTTYDPATHTVTLHPAHRVYLFRQYRLLVNGSTATGVAGATGLLLDGKGNGQPGSDYIQVFGSSILAGPAPAFAARTIPGARHARIGWEYATTRAPRPVPHSPFSAGRIGATQAGHAHARLGAEAVDAALATRSSAR